MDPPVQVSSWDNVLMVAGAEGGAACSGTLVG